MITIDTLPPFYDSNNARSWSHRPDIAQLHACAQTWREHYAISASIEDTITLDLMVIDSQNDFCLPNGHLFVAGRSGHGAIDDSQRIAEFIYRNLPYLTRIIFTLDSHYPLQIFFDSFWIGKDGRCPPPFTTITTDDLRQGIYDINPAVIDLVPPDHAEQALTWARRQVRYYVEELEHVGKYSLTVWPYHTLIGNTGHALVGLLDEARLFHSAVRHIQSTIEIKGHHPWSEHYSVFGAEVSGRWDKEQPMIEKNKPLIDRLIESDGVIFVGQASSHCLMSSVDDLLTEIQQRNATLSQKIYVVRDCTSPVCVFGTDGNPLVDFTEQGEAAFARWAAAGIHIVSSTTPLAQWPNLDRLG